MWETYFEKSKVLNDFTNVISNSRKNGEGGHMFLIKGGGLWVGGGLHYAGKHVSNPIRSFKVILGVFWECLTCEIISTKRLIKICY